MGQEHLSNLLDFFVNSSYTKCRLRLRIFIALCIPLSLVLKPKHSDLLKRGQSGPLLNKASVLLPYDQKSYGSSCSPEERKARQSCQAAIELGCK